MIKIQLKDLQKLQKDSEAKRLLDLWKISQIESLATRAHVDTYRNQVLLDIEIFEEDTGKRILDIDKLYLAEEVPNSIWNNLDKLHQEHGYKVEAGFCPAMIAEEKTRERNRDFLFYCDKVMKTRFSKAQSDISNKAFEIFKNAIQK